MRLPISHCRWQNGSRRAATGRWLSAVALAGALLPVAAHAETLLFTGATVHTVSGETLSPGQVLISDGKVAQVGKEVTIKGLPKTVELNGLHLYPGLIALNTDLGLVEIEAVRATRDMTEVGEGYNPDVKSWLAVNPDSELLPVARANGVAYFEPVPQGGVVSGQSGLLALDGWTTEQMVLKKAIALHVFWPAMNLDTTPKESVPTREKWKSLEDQDKERKEKLKALDDFFAEARAYAKAKAAAPHAADFRIVPAWEAMLPVVRGEIPITVHADDARQIRAAVNWAATNHFKLILADALDAGTVASLLASNQVPVIFNHVFTQPQRDADAYDAHFAAPGALHAAGVKVVFGAGGASLVKNLPYAAAQAVAFGLPADEALKGLTLYPAQLAGVADRLGSIEPGKDATLFAVDGDILDIRTNVKRMWIAGKEVSLESRHTRLYEKYRNRPKP
jgi:imidazolonepropionase-like amidohydrolase